MSTDPSSSPATRLRRLGWRLPFGLAGVVLIAGGANHPDAIPDVPYSVHTAMMTADPKWVPAHLLMLSSMVVLLLALFLARRDRDFAAAAGRVLPWALVGTALSAVELVFHTAAKVDHDELLAGQSAPIALTHESLAVVAYPVWGLAIAALAWRLSIGRPVGIRLLAIVGIVGGVLQAVSAPLVVLSQDQSYSFLFAPGGISIAVWLVLTAVVGVRTPAVAGRSAAAIE